jgi:hypothetical protein
LGKVEATTSHHTKASTFANPAKPNRKPRFAKELAFLPSHIDTTAHLINIMKTTT